MVKKKTCEGEKRREIKKRCKKTGIKSRGGLLRCIIDVCYHMKPLAERATEIMKSEGFIKREIQVPHLPKKDEGTCYSLGDPHYKTFSGKRFDNFWIGDFVLVSGKDFTVHARTRKYNKASVNKRIAANLNGDNVEASSADKFVLNGDTVVNLKVGQKFPLPKGGLIERISSNRAYYHSSTAGYVDAEYLGSGSMKYINLIVKVPNYHETIGACQGNMLHATGLFHNEIKVVQKRSEMKVSKKCHHEARIRCNKKGISKRFLGSCIIDVCANLGTAGVRKGVRHYKENK